jgi:pre-mRNA-processing factor SLU7
LQGVPSQAELAFKTFVTQVQHRQNETSDSVKAKYGGDEHLLDPSDPALLTLLQAQSEAYLEYRPDGTLTLGSEHIPRSKYPEDLRQHNHSQVWGSYWAQGRWGYACCHQTLKQSYCVPLHAQLLRQQQDPEEHTAHTVPTPNPTPNPASVPAKPTPNPTPNPAKRADPSSVTEEDMENYYLKKARWDDPMAKPGFTAL